MHKSLLFAGSLLPLAALAQQPADSLQQLAPVEVRAVRATDRAPFAKTNISQLEIRKANFGQDLPYIFQLTPSAVASSDAGAGVGYTALRIRGTDGTRINVTLNGVPVNDAESQGTFFVNFGDIASSTQSVQIQRGVGTSTNGAGAFGATISIDNLLQRDSAGVDFTAMAGSFNTQRYTLKAGTGLLPGGFRFDGRLSKISSDGYIDRASTSLKSAQFTGSWQPNARTLLRALAMTGTEKTYQAWNGVPEEKLRGGDSVLRAHYENSGLYPTPADSANLFGADPRRFNAFLYQNQSDNYQQDYYQLHATHEFSRRLTAHAALFYTRGRGYYEEYKGGEKYSTYGLPAHIVGGDTLNRTDVIRQLWLDNHFYGGVFSVAYRQRGTSLTLGGSATQYRGHHYGFVKWAQEGGVPADYRWYNLDAGKNDFSGYLKAEQQVGKALTFFGEVQLRGVGYYMNGFRKNPDLKPAVSYTFFNPKGGLSYLLQRSAAGEQRLYASVALAHKEPNRDDFEAGVTAQPKPEQLLDFEGGYAVQRRRWGASVNGFYMHYRDQLILTGRVNDVGAYTRVNVPKSFRRGVEIEAHGTVNSWLSLGGNVSLSQNKVVRFTEFIDAYDANFDYSQDSILHQNTDLAFSPSVVAALIATVKPLRRLEIDLIGKHVGRQYLDNTETLSRSLNPYTLLDARLRYEIAARRQRGGVQLMLQLSNILNTRYENNGYTYGYNTVGVRTDANYYFPQAGFNVLGGIMVKL